jgi:hypothetical protein
VVAIVDTTIMGSPPVWIWDVSYSVGPSSPNCMDDTALVQTLINTVLPYLNLHDPTSPVPGEIDPTTGGPVSGPLAALVVDGLWGPKTSEATILYQQHKGFLDNQKGLVQSLGGVLKQGGDPTNTALYGQATTIWSLNVDVVQNRGTMLTATDFPPAFQPYFNK